MKKIPVKIHTVDSYNDFINVVKQYVYNKYGEVVEQLTDGTIRFTNAVLIMDYPKSSFIDLYYQYKQDKQFVYDTIDLMLYESLENVLYKYITKDTGYMIKQ